MIFRSRPVQPVCPAGFLLLGLRPGPRLVLPAARYAVAMGVERLLRQMERRLGINRHGRSVWVWLMPPLVGLTVAIFSLFMPGVPEDFGWPLRIAMAIFGLFTMTSIAFIYLISFDDDPNQRDDLPA